MCHNAPHLSPTLNSTTMPKEIMTVDNVHPLDKLCNKIIKRLIFHIKDIITKLIGDRDIPTMRRWQRLLNQELDEHNLLFKLLPYADYLELEVTDFECPFSKTDWHRRTHPLIIKYAYVSVLKELKTLRKHRFFKNSPYQQYSLIDVTKHIESNKERMFNGIPNSLCLKLILGLRHAQKARIIINQDLTKRYYHEEGIPSVLKYSSLYFLHPLFSRKEIELDTRQSYEQLNFFQPNKRQAYNTRMWNNRHDVDAYLDLDNRASPHYIGCPAQAIQAQPLPELLVESEEEQSLQTNTTSPNI